MANLNVNIANKLLSYVRHGVDVSDEIKRIYNNSMIFIGDEQQIYVPAMETYVGIGMTSYNNTINRIDAVEDQIAKLAKDLASDMVSRIYANYSLDEVNGQNGIQKDADSPITLTNDTWALNNEITLKGVNDYDPATGFARQNASEHYYTTQTADGDTIEVVNSEYYHNHVAGTDNYDANKESAIPTSGIRVTPHWGQITRVENPITGQSIEKRVGNYIEIDDTLTWSYMTSAYAYTLNFARNFTNAEIDKVYHDLLGDSEYVYNPELFTSVITNVTNEINKLSATDRDKIIYDASVAPGNSATHTHYIEPGKRLVYNDVAHAYFMVDVSRNYWYAPYTGTDVEHSTKDYQPLSEDQLLKLASGITLVDPDTLGPTFIKYRAGESEILDFPQLYTRSIEYGSTYNMNIADGIQTLKEVAYLLDLLSDGSLGSVTYLTYSEFNANTNNGDPTHMSIDNFGSYHVILPTKANPADDEEYGYFVKTGDPENLGINIAYSIAGNKAQIDDLHKHTDLIEEGKSSLRSIQSTSSNYVNLNLESSRPFGEWTNTDANQGNKQSDPNGSPEWDINHPNAEYAGNAYVVGDVNLRVNVQTGITYTTIYSADNSPINPKFVDEFGVVWYGSYTAADMRNLTADGTYYQIAANSDPDNPTMVVEATPALNYQAQEAGLQYYWIPLTKVLGANYNSNDYTGPTQNAVYTKIDVTRLISLNADESLPGMTLTVTDSEGTHFLRKNEVDKYFVRNTDGSYTPIEAGGGMTAAERIDHDPDIVVDAAGKKQNAVYYISDYDAVVLHSWVPGKNQGVQDALATTDWTYAFVSAKLQDIANDLEDILTQANQYTDDRIASLDNEYKYSDFETYWSSYITYWETSDPSIAIAGSSTYNSAYEHQYEEFKTRGRNGETYIGYVGSDGTLQYKDNQFRLSYQTNSQYTYNIIEEDGIVRAETRELPTDKLLADVEVWGEETNVDGKRFVYAPIVINDDPNAEGDTFIEALFNWVATDSDNQVFVKVEGATLEKVPPTSEQPWLGSNDYRYFEQESQTYQQYPSSGGNILTMDDYRDVNDKKWVQLYRVAPKYYELDLTAAVKDSTDPLTKVVVNGYTLSLDTATNNVKVEGEGTFGTADTVLYYISSRPATSTDYFTIENKHYSFDENGNGENSFGLTAHITKLEDATLYNTGFADAFDVQSYIENVITWVDVSATVTPQIVASSEKYYRHVTLDNWRAYNDDATKATSGVVSTDDQLYVRSGSTFSTATNVQTAYFWADDNLFLSVSAPTQSLIDSKPGHVAVKINDVMTLYVERFNATSINSDTPTGTQELSDVMYSSNSDYYVKIESDKINPRNLTLTKYQ